MLPRFFACLESRFGACGAYAALAVVAFPLWCLTPLLRALGRDPSQEWPE